MSGKSIGELTPSEQAAYEQGVADTHERYAAMQAQASEWLSGVLAVLAEMETHDAHGVRLYYGEKLRQALSLDPSVKITCTCGAHS